MRRVRAEEIGSGGMRNGYIEKSDADTLMNVYRKFDIYGNTKEPLTTEEQVLIFCIAKAIKDGKIKSEAEE